MRKMIIMAQHHPQQLHSSQQTNHCQQPANSVPATTHIQAQQLKDATNLDMQHTNDQHQQQQQFQYHQEQQDGKRTLIKNQLCLIEQLQLENANLRNERDQLQLENEELKFQLQMISSSNILSQPGNAFNEQNLERLVEPNNEKTSPINGSRTNNCSRNNTLQSNLRSNNPTTPVNDSSNTLTASVASNRTTGTPIRLPMRLNIGDFQQQQQQQESATLVRASDVGNKLRPTSLIESSIIPLTAVGNKLLAGKSTSLTAFNVKLVTGATNALAPQNRNPSPQDEEEHRVKLVEQLYGDSEHVQAAAIIIQRAFRKYQICKRFRAITEQLRHTYQSSSVNRQSADNLSTRNVASSSSSTSTSSITSTSVVGSQHAINRPQTDPNYAWSTTRAAAWESLSQAASRLAASAASTVAKPASGIKLSTSSQQVIVGQQQQQSIKLASSQLVQANGQQKTVQVSNKQDPVVTAAINFQQLESIRKRQYRVGLNIFNKNPEKGVSFLVAHSFIDSSPPYTKTSSYYPSNQLHFIDKQHLVQQQQQQVNGNSNMSLQNCQMCFEEDNLKKNIAHFLLHRKGLAKEKIGQYLGNLQVQFNQDVLKYYLQELDFYGLQIDLGLRKFLSTFRLPGEAQKIERIVDCFAQRYVQCQQQPLASLTNVNSIPASLLPQQQQQQQNTQLINPTKQQQSANNSTLVFHKNNLILLTKDEIFILTFAIIMLNTDLHSPSLKPTSRMSAAQFVNNLRGVFKSQTINESDLIEIYERVKANQITTTPDHVTHVMKVQQGLTVTNFQKKELPNLCIPHRRLVCFCRLFEVYDANKKERVGQHQREIFLFNDLLLITKLARRVRANTTQLYTYRHSLSLQGLCVQLFQSTHYNFGIRLYQRSTDETIIMFNARNELDQSRFVDDLSESIAEMDEMELIKANNIIETIHFRYSERLKRHSIMHSGGGVNNENNIIMQSSSKNTVLALDDNQAGRKLSSMNNCDIKITNSNKQISSSASDSKDDNKQQQITVRSNNSFTTTLDPSSNARDHHDQPLSRDEAHHQTGKFNSMLNLSSAITDSRSGIIKDEDCCRQNIQSSNTKGLRENQSFVQPPGSRSANNDQSDLRAGGEQVAAGLSGIAAAAASAAHRRCSTSSVHSLDSGLFLSRDVSPNQSS